MLFGYRGLAVFVRALLSIVAWGQTPVREDWNAKFRATYVWQLKPSFGAAYSGPNSLSTERAKSYSFNATAALGFRPWIGGELYFDPEIAQGVPFSSLTGLGGFTNGEMARASGSNPTFCRVRLFLRQTSGMGGDSEQMESDANRLMAHTTTRGTHAATHGALHLNTSTTIGQSGRVVLFSRKSLTSCRSTLEYSGTTATRLRSSGVYGGNQPGTAAAHGFPQSCRDVPI